MHITYTSRSHSRVGSHVSQEQNNKAMQLEINHLKKKLPHARRNRTPSNSNVSFDDEEDASYRRRLRTLPNEYFSYDEEHHRKRRYKSPPHKGLGNDVMGKALNQISKLPFMRKIERAKLPQRFNQSTFTIYNGRIDPVEYVSHFNQKMVVYSKNEALLCKVFLSSLGPVAMRWFDGVRVGSIDFFKELTWAFDSRFITCSRVHRPLDSLLSLSMQEGEILKTYLDKYWEMFNEIDGDFDDVAITRKIEGEKLPRRFNQSTFTIYNGQTNLVEHMSHFNQKMAVHSKNEALICKVFLSSPGLVAMRWFDGLRTDSIDFFKELIRAFGSRFITCSRVPRPLDSLLSLSMRKGEILKTYLDKYWEIFNEIDGDFNDVAISTFKVGLLVEHSLRKSLTGKPVTSVR